MIIRRANLNDIHSINRLMYQISQTHAKIRPDIFVANAKKYSDGELAELIEDFNRPCFVAVNEQGEVAGYVFCEGQKTRSAIQQPIKTLYIENFCVDKNARRQGVGTELYAYVKRFARAEKFYNVTLKVWANNDGAVKFYENLGMKPQQLTMEEIL